MCKVGFLFERGNQVDNPYNIFYTYPYPKFLLKYKGYYGKATETPLLLKKKPTQDLTHQRVTIR
jgi:hypothetical protein